MAASRHIIDTAMRHGLEESACLAGSGLSRTDLNDPATEVRVDQELTVIRNVIGGLGNRTGLGMEAGSRYTLADIGILGYALMASPDFGAAMDVACRYVALSTSHVSLTRPQLRGDEAFIAFDDAQIPEDVRQFLIERDIGMLLRLMPMLIGTTDVPVRIRLEVSNPALPAELKEMGNLTIAVERTDRNALFFPASLLEQPMPVADPQTAAICIRQCEDLLNRRSIRRGISAVVRTRIIQASNEIPAMATVAGELGITERTLHRQLAVEGTSYRNLLDEVRATLAAELLDSGLTVEETARRLGYSEASAFTHAFVRWNGYPPSRRR